MAPAQKKKKLDRETWLIMVVVCIGMIISLSRLLFESDSQDDLKQQDPKAKKEVISMENVPLATGKEPIDTLFRQSGCPVCHTIQGIPGAKGREGPRLLLWNTAAQRLADPKYAGTAETEWEYVVESILEPGAYVVPGYPDRVMPRWYGKKLSAGALAKIATYLLGVPKPS